jgi:FkbM family methyltransferase
MCGSTRGRRRNERDPGNERVKPGQAKSRLLRPATFQNARYFGSAVRTLRNWPRFVVDYVTATDASRVYTLRSGVELETREAIDAATIGVVFLRREYGTIGRDWTVIDVGANIGAFTLCAAAAGGRVYAYEPMLENYELLLRNLNRNPCLGRMQPFPLGVAGRRERRDLFVAANDVGHSLLASNAGAAHKVSIDCVTLADIFTDNSISCCDLLKLDCEGAELEILKAAPAKTLGQIRRIRLEWHPGYDLEELIRLLADHGFLVVSRKLGDDGRGMLWTERPQVAPFA